MEDFEKYPRERVSLKKAVATPSAPLTRSRSSTASARAFVCSPRGSARASAAASGCSPTPVAHTTRPAGMCSVALLLPGVVALVLALPVLVLLELPTLVLLDLPPPSR